MLYSELQHQAQEGALDMQQVSQDGTQIHQEAEMHILKPGTIPEQDTYRGVCHRCGCVFIVKEFETSHDVELGLFHKCPTPGCNLPVRVERK